MAILLITLGEKFIYLKKRCQIYVAAAKDAAQADGILATQQSVLRTENIINQDSSFVLAHPASPM